MSDEPHPIFITNGYQINTMPTTRLANFIVTNISQGHHGCSAYGGGGLGKSTAQQYLTDNASRWLIGPDKQPIGVAARMLMPSGPRRSDRAFWGVMNYRLNVSTALRVEPTLAQDRMRNFIRTRCGQARVRRMVLFIDNAQRITDGEFQYLEDLDAQLADDRLSLFLVLVRQSDAEGVDIGDDWLDRPSHTVRRWFMDTMPFQPLMGLREIAHALSRYDKSVTWPTPEMSFTRYFAREAFEEAGVRGAVGKRPIGAFTYAKMLQDDGRPVPCEVRVFALQVKRQSITWLEAAAREARWLAPADALEMIDEPGLRALIADFAGMSVAAAAE